MSKMALRDAVPKLVNVLSDQPKMAVAQMHLARHSLG